MTAPVPTTNTQQRYTLKLTHYPSPNVVTEVALVLYQSASPNLVASLSGLPYTVGRTFSREELESLHQKLKSLAIGHRFDSMDGVSEVISFHPGDPQRDVEIKLNRKKVRRKKSSLVAITVVTTFLIAGGLVYFIREAPQKENARLTQEPIAEILSIESRVQRRTSSGTQWKEAKTGDSLFDKDALRTFENSQAIIDYREGSSLTVREDSFIIIVRPSDKSYREVSLEDGSIQAQLKQSSQNLELRIQTKQGTIRMRGPKAGEQEVHLQTSMIGGNLAVAVESGQVEITPKGQPSIAISGAQKVEIRGNEKPVIAASDLGLESKTPTPGARLKEGSFYFEVRPVAGAKRYKWIIGSSPEMTTLLVEHRTKEPTLKLQYLDPGELYWRVEAVGEDGMVRSSRVQQIYVE